MKLLGMDSYIGSKDTKGLWNSLPPIFYKKYAVSYRYFWEVYNIVLPKKRHKSVGKETELINRIERFMHH